jgi:hypothetical protein
LESIFTPRPPAVLEMDGADRGRDPRMAMWSGRDGIGGPAFGGDLNHLGIWGAEIFLLSSSHALAHTIWISSSHPSISGEKVMSEKRDDSGYLFNHEGIPTNAVDSFIASHPNGGMKKSYHDIDACFF